MQHLIAMGFHAPMYGMEPEDFPLWLQGLIDEQAQDLEERLGDAYVTAQGEASRRIRLAEKALCCAELTQRRLVQQMALAVPTGEDGAVADLQTQRANYLAEADYWLERVAGTAVATPGYAGGVCVSAPDRAAWRSP